MGRVDSQCCKSFSSRSRDELPSGAKNSATIFLSTLTNSHPGRYFNPSALIVPQCRTAFFAKRVGEVSGAWRPDHIAFCYELHNPAWMAILTRRSLGRKLEAMKAEGRYMLGSRSGLPNRKIVKARMDLGPFRNDSGYEDHLQYSGAAARRCDPFRFRCGGRSGFTLRDARCPHASGLLEGHFLQTTELGPNDHRPLLPLQTLPEMPPSVALSAQFGDAGIF